MSWRILGLEGETDPQRSLPELWFLSWGLWREVMYRSYYRTWHTYGLQLGKIKESRSDKHLPRFSDSITNQDLGNLTLNTCAHQPWYHTWFIAWAFDRPHDREHAMDTDGLNNALTCVVSRWRLPANMIATRRWVSTGTGVEAACFFPRTNYRPNPLKQPLLT